MNKKKAVLNVIFCCVLAPPVAAAETDANSKTDSKVSSNLIYSQESGQNLKWENNYTKKREKIIDDSLNYTFFSYCLLLLNEFFIVSLDFFVKNVLK